MNKTSIRFKEGTMRLKIIKLSLLIVIILWFYPLTLYAGEQIPVAQIPFELYEGYILIKVKINGFAGLNYIFDTGATIVSIDSVTAEKFKFNVCENKKKNGRREVLKKNTWDVSFEIGNLNLKKLDLIVHSQNLMESRLGIKIDGVIGADILRNYVVEINYDKMLFKIYDCNDFIYNGGGKEFNINCTPLWSTMKAGITAANDKIIEGEFLIDTGMGGTVAFNTPFVNENNLMSKTGKHRKTIAKSLGAEMISYTGRVEKFGLGDYDFENVPVILSQAKVGVLSAGRIDGIIGNKIWKKFNTIFDYKKNKLYLEPNRFFKNPFKLDCSGLTISLNNNNKVVIKNIIQDSPGSDAGLQKGDEIISVEGNDIKNYSLSEVRDFLMQTNKTITLVINRRNIIKKYSLKLRQLY